MLRPQLPAAAISAVGVFSTTTGTNIRAALMDVNAPETRGTAFAVFNLVDDLGKGLGPEVRAVRSRRDVSRKGGRRQDRDSLGEELRLQVAALIAGAAGRRESFNICVLMWLVNAAFLSGARCKCS